MERQAKLIYEILEDCRDNNLIYKRRAGRDSGLPPVPTEPLVPARGGPHAGK